MGAEILGMWVSREGRVGLKTISEVNGEGIKSGYKTKDLIT